VYFSLLNQKITHLYSPKSKEFPPCGVAATSQGGARGQKPVYSGKGVSASHSKLQIATQMIQPGIGGEKK
jgi:hypothetical protein